MRINREDERSAKVNTPVHPHWHNRFPVEGVPLKRSITNLTDCDLEVLVERSGSMGIKDCKKDGGFVSRWDFVAEQVAQLVAQACTVDRNGIFLGLFNTRLVPLANASADGVRKAFKRFSPRGGTHIADAIHERIEAYFARKASEPQTRPLVLIVVTDGEPTGTSVDGISKDPQQAVADVIVHATKRLTSGEEISIFFLRVGRDKHAPEFLGWLDAGLTAVGAAFDIVSVKSAETAEDMTISQIITSAHLD